MCIPPGFGLWKKEQELRGGKVLDQDPIQHGCGVAVAKQKSGPGCFWLCDVHESQVTSGSTESSVESCCGYPSLSGCLESFNPAGILFFIHKLKPAAPTGNTDPVLHPTLIPIALHPRWDFGATLTSHPGAGIPTLGGCSTDDSSFGGVLATSSSLCCHLLVVPGCYRPNERQVLLCAHGSFA